MFVFHPFVIYASNLIALTVAWLTKWQLTHILNVFIYKVIQNRLTENDSELKAAPSLATAPPCSQTRPHQLVHVHSKGPPHVQPTPPPLPDHQGTYSVTYSAPPVIILVS
jgi:hypothetical protein